MFFPAGIKMPAGAGESWRFAFADGVDMYGV